MPILIAISGLFIALLICYFEAYSFFVVAAILFIILAFFKKEHLLISLLIFIPLFPKIDMIQVPGTFTTIRIEDFVLALAILWSLVIMLRERGIIKIGAFSNVLILYIIISLFSLFAGVLQGTVELGWTPFLYFLRRIEYLSLLYVGYILSNERSIGMINKWVVRIFFIVALIAILQKLKIIGVFLHGAYITSIEGRMFSTFAAPGEFAAFISILFVFSIMGIFSAKKVQQLYWGMLAAFQLYVLSLSASRAEFMSLPVVVGLFAIIKRQTKYVILIFLLLAALFIVVAPTEKFYALLSPETVDIIKDIAAGAKTIDIHRTFEMQRRGAVNYELSAVERITIWSSAFSKFLCYPLLGVGQSAFGDYVDNNYIRILAENGILGFMAFFLLIYFLCKDCIKVYNNTAMPNEVRNYALVILLIIINLSVASLMVDAFEMSKIAFFLWLLVGVFYKSKNIYEVKILGTKGIKA